MTGTGYGRDTTPIRSAVGRLLGGWRQGAL